MARDLLGNERVRLSAADEHGSQVWAGVASLLWCEDGAHLSPRAVSADEMSR
jgi:hypothetical protein